MRTSKTDANGATGGRDLDTFLGREIKALRRRHGLTIADVAARAHISSGMLSKIENGQSSTSLGTLQSIAEALGVTLSNLFHGFDVPEGGAQHVKKGGGMEVVRRGTNKGHTYHLLAYDQGPRKVFEPFLITMTDKSEIFPSFQHPGTEFIYILEGRIRYRHGRQTYTLGPGDSLTFRGDVPHGPDQLISMPLRFLSIIMYGNEGSGED